MSQKYQFTNKQRQHGNITVWQIQATEAFGRIHKAQLGGWVESEQNLSHIGNCWIDTGCTVTGSAYIRDNAQIMGAAEVSENALVMDNALVDQNAQIAGNACIAGSSIVKGYAVIKGRARIREKAVVYEQAVIHEDGCVEGESKVGGKAMVFGAAVICKKVSIHGSVWVFGQIRLEGDWGIVGDWRISDAKSLNAYKEYLYNLVKDTTPQLELELAEAQKKVAEIQEKIKVARSKPNWRRGIEEFREISKMLVAVLKSMNITSHVSFGNIRQGGTLNEQGIFLGSKNSLKWEIKEDTEGCQILMPILSN